MRTWEVVKYELRRFMALAVMEVRLVTVFADCIGGERKDKKDQAHR